MSSIDFLYNNNWVSVVEKHTDNNGTYVYATSPWCNSTGVAVLGYMNMGSNVKYLGRYELCPAHSDEMELGSIIGGYDNSDKYTLKQCALNELREEGGFDAPVSLLIELGAVKPTKASDNIVYLYAVDIGNSLVNSCEATGDGGETEKGAYTKWVTEEQAIKCKDPLIAAMIARLKLKLQK